MNKLFQKNKIVALFSFGVLLSMPLFSLISNNKIENNTSLINNSNLKTSQNLSLTISSDNKMINYTYDENEVNNTDSPDLEYRTYSNAYDFDSVTGSVTQANINNYWLRLYVDPNNSKQMKLQITNNLVSNQIKDATPSCGIGFKYFRNQYSDPSIMIDKEYNNNDLSNIEGGSGFTDAFDSPIDGVITLRTAFLVNDVSPKNDPFNSYSAFLDKNDDDLNYSFLKARENNLFGASNSNDFFSNQNNRNFKIMPMQTSAGQWNSLFFTLGIYDGKFWWGDTPSNISLSINKKGFVDNPITKSQLFQLTSENIGNYFILNANNTPSTTISSIDSKTTLTFSDHPESNKVTLTVNVPRSYKPNFALDNNVIQSPQWIIDEPMTTSIDIPYTMLKSETETLINYSNFTFDSQSNEYIFDVSKTNYIPYFDYSDIDELSSKLFETTIYNWASTLWLNLPHGLTSSDGSINIDTNESNFADGEIVINSLKLKKYYDLDFNPSDNSSGKEFIKPGSKIKFINLNREPTIPYIQNRPSNLGAMSLTEDNWIEWNAANYYENLSPAINYSNTSPTDFNNNTNNGRVITADDVKYLILKNLPSEYDSTSFRIDSTRPNDKDGTLEVLFSIKNFNNNLGELVTNFHQFKLRFIGLKSVMNWNSLFLQNDNYVYTLSANDLFQCKLFDDYTISDFESYINNNKEYFVDNIKSNYTVSVGNLVKDDSSSSYILKNSRVMDQNKNVVANLDDLKFMNFVFSPIKISPKDNEINNNMFASELIWNLSHHYNDINNPTSILNNSQSEIINQLNTLYDGINTINNNFEVIIPENIQQNANNENGSFSLSWQIKYKPTSLILNLNNNFISAKKGTSSLLRTTYYDPNKTVSELHEFLSNPINVDNLLSNPETAIVNPNGIPLGKISYTLNLNEISDNKFSAEVLMKSAISNNSYVDYLSSPMSLGQVTFCGNETPPSISNETDLVINNEYMFDPLFNGVSTPSQFVEVVANNIDSPNFLEKLVKVVNPVDGAVISIISGPVINGNQVSYMFNISSGYNDNGEIISNINKQITFTLPTGDLVTKINPVFQISDEKYAFEYTNTDLASIPNLVLNPVKGSNISVNIQKIDNRNRTIFAEVSVDKYYDGQGILQNSPLTETVQFVGSKAPSLTTIARNETPIDESLTIDGFKEILDSKNNAAISKYISISPTGYSIDPEWSIKSYNEIDNKNGIFDVTLSLDNYYFINDETMSFIQTKNIFTSTDFIIRFAIKPSIFTEFNTSVVDYNGNNQYYYKANFLDLTNSNDAIINTSNDISDEKIKELVPKLILNNPSLSSDDISFTRISNENNNEIILRNVKIKKYYNNSSSIVIDPNGKNIGTLIIKFKKTPIITQKDKTIDPTISVDTYDTFIDASRVQRINNKYASEIANMFINGDLSINKEIQDAIITKFLYYNSNQKAQNIKITNVKIYGGSGEETINGGLSSNQYADFIDRGILPNNSLDNSLFNSQTVTTTNNNFKISANINYNMPDGQKYIKSASVSFFNTKPMVVPTNNTIKTSFTKEELNLLGAQDINLNKMTNEIENYYNIHSSNPNNPKLKVDINTFAFKDGVVTLQIDINNYVTNNNGKVIIKDLKNQLITISDFQNINPSIDFKTTTLTTKINYQTRLDKYIDDITEIDVKSELNLALSKYQSNFTNLPGLFSDGSNAPIIKNAAINGTNIEVSFYLSKYYILGEERNYSKEKPGPIFSLTLSGYKANLDGFNSMNNLIDCNQAIYNDIVGDTKFDFYSEIRNKLINYLNGTTPAFNQNINVQLITYISSSSFNPTINFENVKIVNNNVSGFINVIDPEIARISHDERWNTGFKFEFINAVYKNTIVSVKDESLTNSVFFNDFSNNPSLIDINSLLSISNIAPGAEVSLMAGPGDNESGRGQIIVHFSSYYSANGLVQDYNYLIPTFFNFKTENTINDFLKDEIDSTELSFNNYSKYGLYSYLNDPKNSNSINELLLSSKNKFLNSGIDGSNIVLSTSDATIVDDESNSILWSIAISLNGKTIYEKIQISGLKSIQSTVFSAQSTLPPNFDFTTISSYFDDTLNNPDLLMTKTKQFISWTGGDEILPNGESIKPISVTVFNASQTSAFINFTFNGIFDSTKKCIMNYVVQTKIIRNSSGKYNIELLNNDLQKNENNVDKNLWIIIPTLIIFTITIISITIWFSRQRKIQNKGGAE